MVERGNNFEPTCSVTARWKGKFLAKVFDDRVFFPASCCFYNKIILSKHFLSVSPVLIGFSTHFLEEFVAAEFILIIQLV